MAERYVTDYPPRGAGGGGTAADITFDDSTTHLGAGNVQTAIEKTNQKVNANGTAIEQINTTLTNKQDKLTAGTNITIDSNNVISADTHVVAEYNVSNENLNFN